MNTSHKVLVGALVVAVLAVGGTALERYATRPKNTAPTYSQLQAQVKTDKVALSKTKASDTAQENILINQNAQLTLQKQSLCSQLALHRLTSTDCK